MEDELYERIRELEEENYKLKEDKAELIKHRDNTIKYMNKFKNANKGWLGYDYIMNLLVGEDNVRKDKGSSKNIR